MPILGTEGVKIRIFHMILFRIAMYPCLSLKERFRDKELRFYVTYESV